MPTQSRLLTESTKLLALVLIGCLFAVFVFLPIDELTSYFEYPEYHLQANLTVGKFIVRQMHKSLTLQTPAKLLVYLVFGGVMGGIFYAVMFYFRRHSSLIMQLERELGNDLAALIKRGEDDGLEFKSSFRF